MPRPPSRRARTRRCSPSPSSEGRAQRTDGRGPACAPCRLRGTGRPSGRRRPGPGADHHRDPPRPRRQRRRRPGPSDLPRPRRSRPALLRAVAARRPRRRLRRRRVQQLRCCSRSRPSSRRSTPTCPTTSRTSRWPRAPSSTPPRSSRWSRTSSLDTIWLGMRVRGTRRRARRRPARRRCWLSATRVDGPGTLVAYLTESFGEPVFYVDSTDGFDAGDGYRDDTADAAARRAHPHELGVHRTRASTGSTCGRGWPSTTDDRPIPLGERDVHLRGRRRPARRSRGCRSSTSSTKGTPTSPSTSTPAGSTCSPTRTVAASATQQVATTRPRP